MGTPEMVGIPSSVVFGLFFLPNISEMVDSVASSSNAFEKEREFYVRDIPTSLQDWDLFRIFRRYGLVNSIRIPPNQNLTDKKYGFVAMIGLDSADNVRQSLTKGRLVVDDKMLLMINDTRSGADKDSKPLKQMGYGNKGRSYVPQQASPSNAVPLNRNRTFEKKKAAYVMPKLRTPDLPLNRTLKVEMVSSPFPPDAEGFEFHVYCLDCAVPTEYSVLQKSMNNFCEQNKCIALLNNAPEIKVGDPLIYGKDGVAYRGIRTAAREIFLMDLIGGKRVVFNEDQVWLMDPEFCNLPTLIACCSIANVEWCAGSSAHFPRYRDVLINWSTKEGGLSITVKGYKKSQNLVDVFGAAGTLVDSLVRQGKAKKVEPEGMCYEREELISLKDKVKGLPACMNKDGAIEKILTCEVAAMSL